jgi:hypothetical protein
VFSGAAYVNQNYFLPLQNLIVKITLIQVSCRLTWKEAIYIYVKGEGKLVPLRSIEEHLGDRRYSSYSFLTSTLEGGEWSASRSGRFTPGERAPGTHCTGGWVGPRAGLDAEVRGKILCLCRGSNPGRPVISQMENIVQNDFIQRL